MPHIHNATDISFLSNWERHLNMSTGRDLRPVLDLFLSRTRGWLCFWLIHPSCHSTFNYINFLPCSFSVLQFVVSLSCLVGKDADSSNEILLKLKSVPMFSFYSHRKSASLIIFFVSCSSLVPFFIRILEFRIEEYCTTRPVSISIKPFLCVKCI
jgi:hypothetical protein